MKKKKQKQNYKKEEEEKEMRIKGEQWGKKRKGIKNEGNKLQK